MFQALLESDPYRLDNVDTYSNLLFVKEMKTEMAQLAHKAVSINKYRPETCCVIGEYPMAFSKEIQIYSKVYPLQATTIAYAVIIKWPFRISNAP